MNLGKGILGMVGLIAFVVYNIIIFICEPQMIASFWVAYIFTVVAFACVIVNILMPKGNDKTTIYNISIAIVSIGYWLVQVFAGSLFMLVTDISIKICIIVEVVLFAMYLIVLLLLIFAKGRSKELNSN